MKYFLLIVVSGLIVQHATAQSVAASKPVDTTVAYYNRLVNSSNKSDKEILETKLYTLLKSEKEKDWILAQRYFYLLKKVDVADSITNACKIQFPLGEVVRNNEVNAIFKESDPVKKEVVYKKWIRKFPASKFGTNRAIYDNAHKAVAIAYAGGDNVKKALRYVNMIETDFLQWEGFASVATVLIENNRLTEGAELFRKAIASSYQYMQTGTGNPGAKFAASAGYSRYCSSLADILYQQKKYAEALNYVKIAHDSSKKIIGGINSTYANILVALGRHNEAFEMIDEAVKEGQANPEMKENLKTLYVKVKGSNNGYDEYMASLNKILIEMMRKEVAKQFIKRPAAMFSLKDVDGNTVSLEDYKGKTIVLDFWATWCVPCKKSFPAMKMAVNKYKDDPNVKFFFIHTWETGDVTSEAKKYMNDHQYPFEVLMDLKEAGTGVNKVAKSYRVSAIPAKFVIDKNANIRFVLSDFWADDDAAVEELSAMIEMAQQ